MYIIYLLENVLMKHIFYYSEYMLFNMSEINFQKLNFSLSSETKVEENVR
jgi:hypothetical protein